MKTKFIVSNKAMLCKATVPGEELLHTGQQYKGIVQGHNRDWQFLQHHAAPYLLLLVLPPLFSLLSIMHLTALVQLKFQFY